MSKRTYELWECFSMQSYILLQHNGEESLEVVVH